MRVGLGLGLGACCAIVIACAGPRAQSAQPSTSAVPEAGGPLPGTDPHGEIDRLDKAIDQALQARGLPAAGAPDPMAVAPATTAPRTCTPAPAQACQEACTLADSICSNADKICEIAKQLGGDDPYANGMCAKGTSTCEAARTRCCNCQR